jgi:hypothetical protein
VVLGTCKLIKHLQVCTTTLSKDCLGLMVKIDVRILDLRIYPMKVDYNRTVIAVIPSHALTLR